MDKKEVRFQHKCRRCGDIEQNLITSYATAHGILMDIISGKPVLLVMAPRMIEAHYCNDGGVGVADFIGFALSETQTSQPD